ncbi:phosphatidylinositol-specific phospholipase C domain-containing protein, partial [Streptomyces sp. 2MCAF27]
MDRRGFLRGTAAVSAAGLVSAISGTATATAAPQPLAPQDWLSGIAGATPVQRLTLPGTHDSGARYGGPWTECQNTTIGDQLNSGIRFLDIRCRAFEGAFPIHHGAYYQHLNFDDVLGACRSFLSAHPSETVLMRVKQE